MMAPVPALAIEARDYVGAAVLVSIAVVAALAGVKIAIDRLLDRRRR